MPQHASDNLAETFAKILCERASFELKEEDVNAYRQHISSLQQAAQFTAAARVNEEEAYRQWMVRKLAKSVLDELGKKRFLVGALSCRALAHMLMSLCLAVDSPQQLLLTCQGQGAGTSHLKARRARRSLYVVDVGSVPQPSGELHRIHCGCFWQAPGCLSGL